MPNVDGYEATQQIKATATAAPVVIALTGSAFEEDRIGAIAIGCDDFVRKPFRAETIFEKMAVHLNLYYRYADETVTADNLQTPSSTENLTLADLAIMPQIGLNNWNRLQPELTQSSS